MEPLESRCLLTPITAYLLPKFQGIQPNPAEITVAGGKLWFVEATTNSIGMIDPADPSNPKMFGQGLTPVGITTGPDNNVWFTEPNTGAIGMLKTSNPTQPIQNYSLPKNPAPRPGGITVGEDQNGSSVIWYTDPGNNAIGMIDPNNPGSPPPEISLPKSLVGGIGSQIVAGPGGKLWFTEVTFDSSTLAVTASAIGAYDPLTAQWSEVTLPSGSEQAAFGITLGSDKNIWFSEAVANRSGSGGYVSSAIEMINLSVSPLALTKFPIPADSTGVTRLPLRLVAGPDGNVWFTDNATSSIVAFDPTTKTFTPSDAPTVTAFNPIPFGITAGLGNVWFTDIGGAVDVATLDTQLVVTTQPPPDVSVNSPFGLTVTDEYTSGVVDTAFNGNVTIALANNPGGASTALGGTVTVAAVNGVVPFSGLTLNNVGNGYTLIISRGGLTAATTNPFDVTPPPPPPPPPPTITGEQVVIIQHHNKKGKPIGKATLSGYTIDYSTAMNQASIGATFNYEVDLFVLKKLGKKKPKRLVPQPIGFTVTNVTSNSVTLMLAGKQKFPKGGRIIVQASPPGGVENTSGVFLAANVILTISQGGRGIF